MGITEDLRKQITSGDYTRIAEIFNRRNPSNQTSISYVRRVILNTSVQTHGTMAEDILSIAEKYLSIKYELNQKLVQA